MSRRSPLALALAALLALAAAGPRAGEGKPDDDKPAQREAQIKVLIPAIARLTIDGNVTRQTGAERLFVTPPLPTDTPSTYTLMASWNDGGIPVRRMAVATVRGG